MKTSGDASLAIRKAPSYLGPPELSRGAGSPSITYRVLIFDNTRNIRLRDAIEEADFVGPKLADGALELFPVRGPCLPVRVEVTSPSSPSSTETFVHTMDSRTTIGVRVSNQVRWKEAMMDDGLIEVFFQACHLKHFDKFGTHYESAIRYSTSTH